MSETKQLAAHYAAIQLDAKREQVVMSYRPTVEMLVAEFDEKYEGVPENSPERVRAKKRRVERFVRYRAAVLELAAAAASLRADCGTDPTDLPEPDDSVAAEYSRIRAAHETYRREQAGKPADDVDEMVEQHREAALDYATAERGSRRAAGGHRQISAAGHAALDDALDGLRHGGAL
jgi:hypothetical protein